MPLYVVSLDIHKCFDMPSREVIVDLALAAGCPKKVLNAWYRMNDQLHTMNCVAGGGGAILASLLHPPRVSHEHALVVFVHASHAHGCHGSPGHP